MMILNIIYENIIMKYNIDYYINYYIYYYRDYFDYYKLKLINQFNYELKKGKRRMDEKNYIYKSNYELNEIIIEDTTATNNNFEYYINLTQRNSKKRYNENRQFYYGLIEDLA